MDREAHEPRDPRWKHVRANVARENRRLDSSAGAPVISQPMPLSTRDVNRLSPKSTLMKWKPADRNPFYPAAPQTPLLHHPIEKPNTLLGTTFLDETFSDMDATSESEPLAILGEDRQLSFPSDISSVLSMNSYQNGLAGLHFSGPSIDVKLKKSDYRYSDPVSGMTCPPTWLPWEDESAFLGKEPVQRVPEREGSDVSGFQSLVSQQVSRALRLLGSNVALPSFLRVVFFDPAYPEFTSIQHFSWAVLLGFFMGVYTALWKVLIEYCVEFVWKTVPERLLSWGVFSAPEGSFPLYHYMWITPAIFGGALAYISAALSTTIPGQNEWINSLHSRGVQESDSFLSLFLVSTAGMASGLSLGPELPLILTAGMIGSWFAVLCKQSVLSARVLNITAAAAAVGGFFGFPMAGALFVLEVPHRMGLQYYEALSSATIASIVAVLTNRLATGNDVTGYYEYPFLNETLPSSIFHNAIVFGIFGGMVGVVYTRVVLFLKAIVHGLYHTEHHVEADLTEVDDFSYDCETTPLVAPGHTEAQTTNHATVPFLASRGMSLFGQMNTPTRTGFVGVAMGAIVGLICMHVPHVMFWGESQLQNLIDKGRTPLPIFGQGDELSAGLVFRGVCIAQHQDGEMGGFGLGCSALIASAKIVVTGLSLGTGIVGGHFWAPLFVGCASSHFLTDLVSEISGHFGTTWSISAYPCVALLCIMGATHVVTFRAHMAIILILTLTIDAFNPEDTKAGAFKVAGDYSAVFPLLTVAVFVSLQITRHTVFYNRQRSRGDIMAMPEVLCEPGKEGQPLVMDYDGILPEELAHSHSGYETDGEEAVSETSVLDFRGSETQIDIEAQFEARYLTALHQVPVTTQRTLGMEGSGKSTTAQLPPRPQEVPIRRTVSALPQRAAPFLIPDSKPTHLSKEASLSSDTKPRNDKTKGRHRRTHSAPLHPDIVHGQFNVPDVSRPMRERNAGSVSSALSIGKTSLNPVSLKRVTSFGQVDQEQPCLLDQARRRSASIASADERYR